VIAIEPTQASVQLLRRNASLNDIRWIDVIEAAASDRDGHALLNVNRLSPMWNSLHAHDHKSVESAVSVPTVALDSVISAAGWPPVAGVKLDVEGAEKSVLIGARETLSRNPRAFVTFEVFGSQPEGREASEETLHLLEADGYRFRCLQEGADGAWVGASDVLRILTKGNWQESLINVLAERTG
jgi:FkbM family methyltransferase